MSFWEEVKRRKVVRVAVVYSIVAWLLVEIAVTVEAPLSLPGWMDTFVISPGFGRISVGSYSELGLRPNPYWDKTHKASREL